MHAILTSKGQTTLPKALRKKLCLSPGDRLDVFLEVDDSVRLMVKKTPIGELKGILPKPDQPVSLEEMNRALQEGVGKS
jgi:AbrB family looped-hinge helix DNA binding protein